MARGERCSGSEVALVGNWGSILGGKRLTYTHDCLFKRELLNCGRRDVNWHRQ